MRKYLIGFSAAAIVGLAAGCGSGEPDTPAMDHSQSATSTSADSAGQAEHNDQDIAFAQAMIPHHRQAVDMATMAAKQATDPKVKDLASRIESAQEPEIQQLTGMLEQWGAPAGSSTPGMDHGGTSSEPGMMTDEEMQQLEQATSTDFDRLWIQLMIKHHQGAVDMAKTELEKGNNTGATALAQKIIDAQEAEITEMRAMAP
jgi:uncharacterized protein (DUF305 family)